MARMLLAALILATCVCPVGAQLPDFDICVRRGIAYFKEIGSWPTLSDGRNAEQVVRERCRRSTQAFPP